MISSLLSVSTGQSNLLGMSDAAGYLISPQLLAVKSLTLWNCYRDDLIAQSQATKHHVWRLTLINVLTTIWYHCKAAQVQTTPKISKIPLNCNAVTCNPIRKSTNALKTLTTVDSHSSQFSRFLFSRSSRVHSPLRSDLFSLSHSVDDCISLSSSPPSASKQELREAKCPRPIEGARRAIVIIRV